MTAIWSAPEYRSPHCSCCGDLRVFEQPPSLEGLGGAVGRAGWARREPGPAMLLAAV